MTETVTKNGNIYDICIKYTTILRESGMFKLVQLILGITKDLFVNKF